MEESNLEEIHFGSEGGSSVALNKGRRELIGIETVNGCVIANENPCMMLVRK